MSWTELSQTTYGQLQGLEPLGLIAGQAGVGQVNDRRYRVVRLIKTEKTFSVLIEALSGKLFLVLEIESPRHMAQTHRSGIQCRKHHHGLLRKLRCGQNLSSDIEFLRTVVRTKRLQQQKYIEGASRLFVATGSQKVENFPA